MSSFLPESFQYSDPFDVRKFNAIIFGKLAFANLGKVEGSRPIPLAAEPQDSTRVIYDKITGNYLENALASDGSYSEATEQRIIKDYLHYSLDLAYNLGQSTHYAEAEAPDVSDISFN